MPKAWEDEPTVRPNDGSSSFVIGPNCADEEDASQPARKPESQAATALQKDWMREEEREGECIGTEEEIYRLMQKRGEEKDSRPHCTDIRTDGQAGGGVSGYR